MIFSLDDMIAFLPSLLHGAMLTIAVSLLAFSLALVFGLAIGIARISRLAPLRVVAACYIQFIRGTPLLLQLFFIYYVLPYVGIVLTPFVSGAHGADAELCGVYGGGVPVGHPGDPERPVGGGPSVGMSRRLLMRRIILPQAFRIIIPSIGNFFVSIFKDSRSGVGDHHARPDVQRPVAGLGHVQAFRDLREVAVIYFLISYPTAKFVEWIEAKIDITRRPVVIGMRG